MQYFHHDTKSLIWKTVLDPITEVLVLEIREDEARKVSFSAVDLADGKALWQNVSMDEPWWMSLSAAVNGRAFLFEYGDSQYPEPKGITALDVQKGKVCWKDPDKQLEQVGVDAVVAFEVDGYEKLYSVLDATDGKVKDGGLASMPSIKLPSDTPLLPTVRYTSESAHYPTVARFIQAKTGRAPVQHIDYVEHLRGIVINYYQREAENTLSQWLLVADLSGKVLLDENTGMALKGMGMETFMVMNDTLVYIKDKRHIVGYRL